MFKLQPNIGLHNLRDPPIIKTYIFKVVYTRYIFLIYIYRRLFDLTYRAQPINSDKTITK